MNALWWTLLGLAAGVVLMLPLVRLLLRREERRARDAERRARDAERLAELGSMTGGLAHEIKNPLSTVGLNAQLLGEGIADSDLPEEEKNRLMKRLEALRREVDRLRHILTDFLQFAGRLKLDPSPHDMARMVDELCDFFLPQCERAGVVLRPQIPEQTIIADVDEGLIKQAILNLMINAVQAMARDRDRTSATHEVAGELMVRVQPGDHSVEIHVIDTGPGIDPGQLEKIFHPYVSDKPGGTGLGLPISRRIVEEHGGRLEVESERGRGTSFRITLPRSETAG